MTEPREVLRQHRSLVVQGDCTALEQSPIEPLDFRRSFFLTLEKRHERSEGGNAHGVRCFARIALRTFIHPRRRKNTANAASSHGEPVENRRIGSCGPRAM